MNLIAEEIYRRINKKSEENPWIKLKSITIHIDLYNQLATGPDYFQNMIHWGAPNGPQIFGLPIKIVYKRKNLIQINTNKTRRKKRGFVMVDYPYMISSKQDKKDSMILAINSLKKNLDSTKKPCFNIETIKFRNLKNENLQNTI